MSKSEFHQISLADLQLEKPVPWDIYDANEKLLARKGFVPQSEKQLEALVSRGLFAREDEYSRTHDLRQEQAEPDQKPQHHVLSMLEQAHSNIQGITLGMVTGAPLPDTFSAVIKTVAILDEAFTINPDIAFASILFKQSAQGYANRHLIDAAILSMAVAKSMNKPAEETALIAAAALTMNIGMLQLQEDLQNRDAPPTEEEQAEIRKHPLTSGRLLREAGITDARWLDFVQDHHENMDGSGYPGGRTGDAISDGAKIIALADRYTAMIAPRKYRKAMLPSQALRTMLIDGGKTCDARIAAFFIKELGIYPPGACVKLVNGEIGIVLRKGYSAMAPAVLVIKNQYGTPLPSPQKRDTEADRFAIKEAILLEADDIPFTMQHLWGSEAT